MVEPKQLSTLRTPSRALRAREPRRQPARPPTTSFVTAVASAFTELETTDDVKVRKTMALRCSKFLLSALNLQAKANAWLDRDDLVVTPSERRVLEGARSYHYELQCAVHACSANRECLGVDSPPSVADIPREL